MPRRADISPGTVAHAAGCEAVALRPRTTAPLARLIGREPDRLVRAAVGLFERHGQSVLEISSTGRPGRAPAAAHEIPKDAVEDVAETAEAAGTGRAGLQALLEGRMAHLIVRVAPFRVLQDLVGLVDVLEHLLGLVVARIPIRVMLLGQAPVRTLDGLGIGVAVNAEHLVEVRHAVPCRLAAEQKRTPPVPDGHGPQDRGRSFVSSSCTSSKSAS